MQQTTLELQERTRRFAAGAAALCNRLPADPSAQRTAKKLLAASKALVVGYKDVCASASPEKFISGISVVAREAKRARGNLQMLLQLNHVTIESARDVLLEARALEAIFRASRTSTVAEDHGLRGYPSDAGATPLPRARRFPVSPRPSASGTP
jgi:hypothetical protein